MVAICDIMSILGEDGYEVFEAVYNIIKEQQLKQKYGSEGEPTKEILERLLNRSPTLTKLFTVGTIISNPFDLTNANTDKTFEGKEFPTYFNSIKKYEISKSKHSPINQRFRIQFETDAENNYFYRDMNPGSYKLRLEDGTDVVCSLNLWNGIANLNVTLPENARINDKIKFLLEVNDETRLKPFEEEFYVIVDEAINNKGGGEGYRKPPRGDENNGDRKKPNGLAVPNLIEVYNDKWAEHNFDKYGALDVRYAGDNLGYDFYVNMDNVWLQDEVKTRAKIEPSVLKEQFKLRIFLVGIALLTNYTKDKEEDSITEKIAKTTKAIAPVMLSIIWNLSTLNE